MGCDQCQVISIQGLATHELGCPNAWQNPATGEAWTAECDECGSAYVPHHRGQSFCSSQCSDLYNGWEVEDDPQQEELEL